MTAIMKPAGAPRGLRLDAMTPAAALRSAAGGCLMGFKSHAPAGSAISPSGQPADRHRQAMASST
jgi:hypothetical protein